MATNAATIERAFTNAERFVSELGLEGVLLERNEDGDSFTGEQVGFTLRLGDRFVDLDMPAFLLVEARAGGVLLWIDGQSFEWPEALADARRGLTTGPEATPDERGIRVAWSVPDRGSVELNTMAVCAEALGQLDTPTRERALRWLLDLSGYQSVLYSRERRAYSTGDRSDD